MDNIQQLGNNKITTIHNLEKSNCVLNFIDTVMLFIADPFNNLMQNSNDPNAEFIF